MDGFNMDGVTDSELLLDILPDHYLHDDSEMENLPTPDESFFLSLCGVSSFTGLQHAIRAGYGCGNTKEHFEHFNLHTNNGSNSSGSKVGRSLQAISDSEKPSGRSKGEKRTNTLLQAIKHICLGTNGDKIQAKLAQQRNERSKREASEAIESASNEYDFGFDNSDTSSRINPSD